MLVLFSRHLTSRQRYVAGVLREAYGLDLHCEERECEAGFMFVTLNDKPLARWRIHPLGIDGAAGDTEVMWTSWEHRGEVKCRLILPCATGSNEEALSFDPLAATFWGLTCWHEQHDRCGRDVHGRPETAQLPWSAFSGEVVFKEHGLEARHQHRWPWLEVMWTVLFTEWGVDLPKGITFKPTIDVDVAYKHLGRSRLKTAGLYARDLLSGRWSLARERWAVRRGCVSDPYDTYGWLKEVHREENLWWFILAADRTPPYDIGLDPELSVLQHLVEALSWHPGASKVCWHPGYRAMDEVGWRRRERVRFEGWQGASSGLIRSHFLRSHPARDWVMWEQEGVQEDASLGWSRDVGFRAGVSRPFLAYDVQRDREMALTIHPIAVMDSALRVGLDLEASEAQDQMDRWMAVVAEVGGDWMSCWHNTSVSDSEEWVGWRATYLHMVQTARSLS